MRIGLGLGVIKAPVATKIIVVWLSKKISEWRVHELGWICKVWLSSFRVWSVHVPSKWRRRRIHIFFIFFFVIYFVEWDKNQEHRKSKRKKMWMSFEVWSCLRRELKTCRFCMWSKGNERSLTIENIWKVRAKALTGSLWRLLLERKFSSGPRGVSHQHKWMKKLESHVCATNLIRLLW